MAKVRIVRMSWVEALLTISLKIKVICQLGYCVVSVDK